MEILAKIGVDWKLFVAQIVNFLILLFVLRRFAYKPMLAFLEARTERIDQGLKDAQTAKKRLGQMARKEVLIIEKAKQEAKELLSKAEAQSKQQYDAMIVSAKLDIARMTAQAQASMRAENEKLLQEAKASLVELTLSITEKVLQEKIESEKDEELVYKHIRSIA